MWNKIHMVLLFFFSTEKLEEFWKLEGFGAQTKLPLKKVWVQKVPLKVHLHYGSFFIWKKGKQLSFRTAVQFT